MRGQLMFIPISPSPAPLHHPKIQSHSTSTQPRHVHLPVFVALAANSSLPSVSISIHPKPSHPSSLKCSLFLEAFPHFTLARRNAPFSVTQSPLFATWCGERGAWVEGLGINDYRAHGKLMWVDSSFGPRASLGFTLCLRRH